MSVEHTCHWSNCFAIFILSWIASISCLLSEITSSLALCSSSSKWNLLGKIILSSYFSVTEWKKNAHYFRIVYSRLSLSRIPRDSLKYFEISVVQHIRFAELRKKIIWLTTFNKLIGNWTFEVRDILKILWKRGGAISPLFYNIFPSVVRFSCIGRDQIFTSR